MSSEALKVQEVQGGYVRTALSGHWLHSPNVEIHVEMDRDCRSIWGHNTPLAKAGRPEVVLLSEDSTPQRWVVRPEALSEFEAAVKRLIENGMEFHTVLRPGWALPALLWTLEYH